MCRDLAEYAQAGQARMQAGRAAEARAAQHSARVADSADQDAVSPRYGLPVLALCACASCTTCQQHENDTEGLW